MEDELLEGFDELGNVSIPVSRSLAHTEPRRFWHGVVNIWLVNKHGQLLCSKRSKSLAGNPGLWQTYFGGHLKTGQSFYDAVIAEMNEEVGLQIELKKLHLIEEGKADAYKHIFKSYAYLYNDSLNKLSFADGEITEVKWMSMDEYWQERNRNLDNWCNGCNPENQKRIKDWLEKIA